MTAHARVRSEELSQFQKLVIMQILSNSLGGV